MKRKGKHMLKERNPVVRDTIRNPNRSNKVHGDKFRSVMDKLLREKYNKNLTLRIDYDCGNKNI